MKYSNDLKSNALLMRSKAIVIQEMRKSIPSIFKYRKKLKYIVRDTDPKQVNTFKEKTTTTKQLLYMYKKERL